MPPSKSEKFTNEFVILFGFFGGLFTRVGVDPETELIKAFLSILEPFVPIMKQANPWIVILITIVLTVLSVLGAYSLGGRLGLVAVACAWVGGYVIIGDSTQAIIGVFLLIIALLIGMYVIDQK